MPAVCLKAEDHNAKGGYYKKQYVTDKGNRNYCRIGCGFYRARLGIRGEEHPNYPCYIKQSAEHSTKQQGVKKQPKLLFDIVAESLKRRLHYLKSPRFFLGSAVSKNTAPPISPSM